MGIYDRDYIRDTPQQRRTPARRAASALAMWSVNTWIIVICVAVFAIDNYVMPLSTWRPVLVGQRFEPGIQHPLAIQLDNSGRYGEVYLVDESKGPTFNRAIVDLTTKQQVGFNAYVWMSPLDRWLHFSTSLAVLKLEFWRFIGFQFLHANTSHLLFNMMGLYFFGSLVEEYLGSKRYLAFYLLCGIFGALMYLVLNLLGVLAGLSFHEGVKIPGLLFTSMNTPLVGASAGIFGVLMAGAFLAPRAMVYVFFILPMQLRTLAYALLAVAFFTLLFGGNNAGGEAGHLGGALAGYYFIRHPHHLHGFFDILGRIDPTSHHYRGSRPRQAPGFRSVAERMEIDRILDKIRRDGMHSLTDVERKVLHDASHRGTAR